MDSGKVPLLEDYDEQHFSTDEETYKKAEQTKEAIETILEKTDANVAAIRDNLPSHSLETPGAFHFVDATTPDNTFKGIIRLIILIFLGIWMLFGFVIFLFVVVPLFLTLIEERNEAEALLQQKHNNYHQ